MARCKVGLGATAQAVFLGLNSFSGSSLSDMDFGDSRSHAILRESARAPDWIDSWQPSPTCTALDWLVVATAIRLEIKRSAIVRSLYPEWLFVRARNSLEGGPTRPAYCSLLVSLLLPRRPRPVQWRFPPRTITSPSPYVFPHFITSFSLILLYINFGLDLFLSPYFGTHTRLGLELRASHESHIAIN